MESFTIELISNASAQPFQDNTLSSLTNFLQEQLTLGHQGDAAIWEISKQSMYENLTEGKFMFFDEKKFEVV